MVVKDAPKFDTGRNMTLNQPVAVSWIPIENQSDPGEDTLRYRAQEKGAAIVCRGEGLWFDGTDIYFSATAGGQSALGQIFKYTETSENTGVLTCIAQPDNKQILNMPDNITISPFGSLFIAEDGSGRCHIRYLRKKGDHYVVETLARNALSDSEFAGVCFDPNGRALFFNNFADGYTFAIEGPFHTLV